MKKIRFLAIFLVLLMLAMPVLTACNNEKDPNEDITEEDPTTTTTKRKRPTGGDQGDNIIPPGYAVLENFNSRALGNFGSAGQVQSVGKTGVSYQVVEADNYAEGESVARALHLYRKAGGVSDTDGHVNLTPSIVKIADVYAVEMDLMVTEKTTGTVQLNGRKASSPTQFNNFLTYTANTGELTANKQVAAKLENNKWYTITVMVYDEARYYDVYVDGWKVLGEVDYANAAYPKRSETDINLYRITMNNAATETEFYLDNLAIYLPTDENNRPMDYQGNMAKTYESIIMPPITLFDANEVTTENYQQKLAAIMGAGPMANLNGYVSGEGAAPITGKTDLKDAYRIDAVHPDGSSHTPLVNNWGDEMAECPEGYDKYLFLDGYKSGFNNATFLFDPVFMADSGISVLTGKEVKEIEEGFQGSDTALFYDISNYSTMTIEFFIPEETRNNKDYYQFLVYLASGNREGGISYYNVAYKTNAKDFANGFFAVTINIGTLGGTRSPSLTTVTGIEIKFNGWNNGINGVGTEQSDEHPIAIKTIKLSGATKVPVEDPAEGMEGCTHTLEDGTDAMTDEVSVLPTCTDYGYTAWKCTLCGKTTPKTPGADTKLNEVLLKPNGHKYGSSDENAEDYNERTVVYPTCVMGGSATAPCLDCGVPAVQESYAPLGHAYVTKINTQDKEISFECPVCGHYEFSKFAEDMPTFDNLKDIVTAGSTNVRGGFVGNVDITSVGTAHDYLAGGEGTSTPIGTLTGRFSIVLRGAKAENMSETVGENTVKFVRIYNQSSAHSYGQVQNTKTNTPEDTVIEMSLRTGPKVDGKYPDFGDIWARDNTGDKPEVYFGKINEGKVTFSNTSFFVELSETEFTNIALVCHFTSGTMDVYVNGVMKAKDITITTKTGDSTAAFVAHEFRMFQFTGAKMGDSWIDAASVLIYSGAFPAAFTDVELDGIVSEFNGPVLDYTFDDDYTIEGDDNVFVDGDITVTDNALAVKGEAGIVFAVDPLKRNTNYVISIDFKGSENNMKNGILFAGLKTNYYGESLMEEILTVVNGDIMFYNQIIGSTTEDLLIEIAVNEDTHNIDVYVNGEYLVSGWFANADYYNVEDDVFVVGYAFGCFGDGEYTIDSFAVATGKYEG